MRKASWLFGFTLLVAATTVVAVAVPAGSQQPPARGTITLFDASVQNYEKIIDEGRKGFSPGDMILFVDAQFDPETCERVGKVVGRLTISRLVGRENAWFLGDFTIKLADGKLIATGAAKFSEFSQTERGVFAITGGTDAYRDASGEVKFQEGVTMCGRRGALTIIDTGPQP